ncbi:hypothetical protein WJR50_23135 [Catalinimonas sp. 4WD22]|jgi:tetratricopeptide (TPR) repeat protein|uniref:hypothetical protein n=1 Tax=Catalinimonas locisalis TaxID=3133978 RepID=UPI0031018D5C
MHSWKLILVLCSGLFYQASFAQEILELRYCVLFDTYQEQQVFHDWQQGKGVDLLSMLSAYDPHLDSITFSSFSDKLQKELLKLQRKQTQVNDTLWLIKRLFYQLHQKFLKRYQAQASFADLIRKGEYNCLSGTMLYAYVLEYLNIPYMIYETPQHVFLRVFLEEETLVFEATDPMHGVHTQQKMLFKGEQAVLWISLIGLQYFNVGIKYYEEGQYLNALRSFRKAQLLYPASERIRKHLAYTFNVYEQSDWLSLRKN